MLSKVSHDLDPGNKNQLHALRLLLAIVSETCNMTCKNAYEI